MSSSNLGRAIVVAAVISTPAVCLAGQAFDPAAALQQANNTLSQRLYGEWAALQGATNADAERFVASATTVQGIAASISPSMAAKKYSLAVKLTVSPFALGTRSTHAPGNRALHDSNLELQYKPVTYDPHGTSGKFSGGHAIMASYKIKVIGNRDITDEEKTLNGAISTAMDSFMAPIRAANRLVLTDTEQQALTAHVARVLDPLIAQMGSRLANQFQLSVKPAYSRSWAASSQDEAAMNVTATKGVPFGASSPRRIVTISGDVTGSQFPERGSKLSRSLIKTGISAKTNLTPSVAVSLNAAINRNGGSGFHGIDGVADASRKTEANLAQSLFMSIARLPLIVTLTQKHLGTGSRDFGISGDLGLLLSPGR